MSKFYSFNNCFLFSATQDIKIPAPAPAPETSLNGGSDVVDHARTSPLPEIAPSKKGKDKKKGGKSIFYTSSSSNSRCGQQIQKLIQYRFMF